MEICSHFCETGEEKSPSWDSQRPVSLMRKWGNRRLQGMRRRPMFRFCRLCVWACHGQDYAGRCVAVVEGGRSDRSVLEISEEIRDERDFVSDTPAVSKVQRTLYDWEWSLVWTDTLVLTKTGLISILVRQRDATSAGHCESDRSDGTDSMLGVWVVKRSCCSYVISGMSVICELFPVSFL